MTRLSIKLICIWVPELDDKMDAEQVCDILKCGLHFDNDRHVIDMQRVGRPVRDRVRPVRVKLQTVEGKYEVLRRAKHLKGQDSFKKIFIQLNMTAKQQKVDKDLTDHLKAFRDSGETNVQIRADKIIKTFPVNRYKLCISATGCRQISRKQQVGKILKK